MPAASGTQYFRGEVWDTENAGVAADWQAVVVVSASSPSVAVTPPSPKSGQSITVTYAQAPDATTWIGLYKTGDSNLSYVNSATVPNVGSGTLPFTLGSSYQVGQSYEARMFSSGSYNVIATSSSFTVAATNPTYTLTVTGGTVDGAGSASGLPTGAIKGIVATVPNGQTFTRWSMVGAGNGVIGDALSSSTTFTVGTTDATVQAICSGVPLIPPNPPIALAATGITGTGFTANWSASTRATSYQLDVSSDYTFSSYVPGIPTNLDNVTTYVVSGLNPNTNYYYRVRAVNTAGISANSNTISTSPIPAITTQPSSQSVSAGANVTFTVAATGTPAPTYQWQKNGTNLSNGGNVSNVTSTTLMLTNVQTGDAATYTAVATNTAGSATSSGAILTVSSGGPQNDTTNQNQLNIHIP